MKTLNTVIITASALLLSASGLAQITTFESGTPASASEMNANFATIVEAIEALETRVTDLEDDAGDRDVANRSYRVYAFHNKHEQQVNAEDATFLDLISAGTFGIGFDADSAAFATVGGVSQSREQGMGWFLDGVDPDFFESPSAPFMSGGELENLTFNNGGTGPLLLPYTQNEFGVITIEGIDAQFSLSPSGDMLIGTTRHSLTDSFEVGVFIGVEVFPTEQ